MPLYEHVFLCRHDISQAQVEALGKTFRKIIEDNGGKISRTEYWGLKTLAYKIKKNRKAHFSLMNINAPAPAIAEMERQMRLSDDVLRFLTLRVDELDEQPSPMMRPERDDRRGRRGGPGRDRDRGPRDRDGRDRDGRGREAGRSRPPQAGREGLAEAAPAPAAQPAKTE